MPVPELRLTFDNVRDKNLEQLKTLSRAIFPIKYHVCSSIVHGPDLLLTDCFCALQDAVYEEIIKAGELSRLGAA